MKIALSGYGRMGKAVEEQALKKGYTISDIYEKGEIPKSWPGDADCVIDFSYRDVAPKVIMHCIDRGIPVVSGTTGWSDKLADILRYCDEFEGTMCFSPNFSIGMQIMFYLNKVLAKAMNEHPEYKPQLLEIHHTDKVDTPSGTAIELAKQMISNLETFDRWTLSPDEPSRLYIEARREPDVKGIHRITYIGDNDSISIRHNAFSRDGFALGAIYAAEWLRDKTGHYSFQQILGFTPTE